MVAHAARKGNAGKRTLGNGEGALGVVTGQSDQTVRIGSFGLFGGACMKCPEILN